MAGLRPGHPDHRRGLPMRQAGWPPQRAAMTEGEYFSIVLERVLVVETQRWRLVVLVHHRIPAYEDVDFRPHEAAKCVLGRADDRLAAHIETGVDDNRAPRLVAECRDQRVVARIGFAMHGLNARR